MMTRPTPIQWFFICLLFSTVAIGLFFFILDKNEVAVTPPPLVSATATPRSITANTPTPCADCQPQQTNKKRGLLAAAISQTNHKLPANNKLISITKTNTPTDNPQVDADLAKRKPDAYKNLTDKEEKTLYLDDLATRVGTPAAFYTTLFSLEADAELKQQILQMSIQDYGVLPMIELIKAALAPGQAHDLRLEALSETDDIPKDILKPYANDPDPDVRDIVQNALANP